MGDVTAKPITPGAKRFANIVVALFFLVPLVTCAAWLQSIPTSKPGPIGTAVGPVLRDETAAAGGVYCGGALNLASVLRAQAAIRSDLTISRELMSEMSIGNCGLFAGGEKLFDIRRTDRAGIFQFRVETRPGTAVRRQYNLPEIVVRSGFTKL
jgi:hypothetical protein